MDILDHHLYIRKAVGSSKLPHHYSTHRVTKRDAPFLDYLFDDRTTFGASRLWSGPIIPQGLRCMLDECF